MNPITSHEEWLLWLKQERHISKNVSEEAGLTVYRTELAIPILDTEGTRLFYKYRRNFKSDQGPKYRYDPGSTAALYGAETLKFLTPNEVVVITEGELDSLALRTLGHHAVSTTGGAGTWRDEWSTLLAGFNVVIAYDADGAGVEGALKVASQLPDARIAWLPVEYGKDPTEIIHNKCIWELEQALKEAKRYQVPSREADERGEALKALQKMLAQERKECMSFGGGSPLHRDIALAWVARELEAEKKATVRGPRKHGSFRTLGDDVAAARATPIMDLIKVNRQRKAKCLWHTDKDPSLHVYDDHAFCFVCGKRADAIDIYMAINNCDFKTAVAALIT